MTLNIVFYVSGVTVYLQCRGWYFSHLVVSIIKTIYNYSC